MPNIFIFAQIPRKFEREKREGRTIHRVAIPSVTEKGFYRAVSSYNAFRGGTRKDASAADRKTGHDACCWNDEYLFYGQHESEWLREQELRAGSAILADLDERKLTPIEHASIWDFYKHIGFDHKARRYITKEEK